MEKVSNYLELLEASQYPRQKIVMESLVEHKGDKKKVIKECKIDKNNLNRMIRTINKYIEDNPKAQENNMYESVPAGYGVKGLSTYINKEGEQAGQWIKVNKKAEDVLNSIKDAIDSMAESVAGKAKKTRAIKVKGDMLNLYISNDLHFGALAWGEETQDHDYDLGIAEETLDRAINHLVDNSPQAKTAIVCDLGDLLEADDFKNATPQSGHNLDVDGRYPKIIKTAMESMVKMIDKALTKHELVHFINISGNHDITSGHAVRAFIEAWYRNEPRVIVDTKPTHQKYFKHGKVLLGFAHGDGLKMHDAGELMAVHCQDVFSDTIHRHYHFGHNHKDKIVDGRICKAESHRNLAPLNSWASHAGFARQLGTMKALTYCPEDGLENVTLFNVNMRKDK